MHIMLICCKVFQPWHALAFLWSDFCHPTVFHYQFDYFSKKISVSFIIFSGEIFSVYFDRFCCIPALLKSCPCGHTVICDKHEKLADLT